MKHLKLFESFQNQLTDDQIDELTEIVIDYVDYKKMNSEESQEYFKPGTQNFADFLKHLEDETDWFDYTQMDSLMDELSFIINELDAIEKEENEFDDSDSIEIEEGDLVDFDFYGKVYIISIADYGYVVSREKEQVSDNGDNYFIIPYTKIKDYNIIEKGYDDFDEDEY